MNERIYVGFAYILISHIIILGKYFLPQMPTGRKPPTQTQNPAACQQLSLSNHFVECISRLPAPFVYFLLRERWPRTTCVGPASDSVDLDLKITSGGSRGRKGRTPPPP